jgi:hypothetical protein
MPVENESATPHAIIRLIEAGLGKIAQEGRR